MTETKLKTLLLDIETAPNLGYTWGKYEQDVVKFVHEWYIMCFTAKWLDSGKTVTMALCDFAEYDQDSRNDKKLAEELHKLLDEADIVVAHNGDKFDLKRIHSRFVVHGLTPPSPYKSVDTLKVVKKYFGFNSNKLNDLGEMLNLGTKIDTGGFSLWEDCMNGNKAAWKKMKAYNKQDVNLLEKVYLRVRPWMTNHPLADHSHDINCHVCSRTTVQKRGYTFTKVSRYQRYQCQDCGSWGHGPLEKKE